MILKSNKPGKIGLKGIFQIELGDPDSEETIGTCKAEIFFGFGFPQLDSFSGEGHLPWLHPDLKLSLLTLAYSTARGIILEKTSGTIFSKAFLPVFAPADLVSRPMPSSQPPKPD
ncbi:MAG: hypothetical protein AAFR61_15140 [Bacteroidota bacterium]